MIPLNSRPYSPDCITSQRQPRRQTPSLTEPSPRQCLNNKSRPLSRIIRLTLIILLQRLASPLCHTLQLFNATLSTGLIPTITNKKIRAMGSFAVVHPSEVV